MVLALRDRYTVASACISDYLQLERAGQESARRIKERIDSAAL
jgi:hypothetical protein